MTAAISKFTFDVDMSHKPEQTRVLTADKLAEMTEFARKEGYQQGFAEGETSEQSRTAQALLSAANTIAQRAAEMVAAREEIQRMATSEAVQLGAAVGRKLAHHLLAQHPTAELDALIGECMSTLDQAPHLVIRCHPDLTDPIQETAENSMATSGFSGRLIVMGDPEIPLSDGRIEWADGGLVREQETISAQIDKCIGDYLDAHGTQVVKETEQ